MNPSEMVLASFVADSHALGPHWVYNQNKLAAIYPEGVRELDEPRSAYHPEKSRGDLTHYGDQTLALLESIVAAGGYASERWHADWVAFWEGNTRSYRDGATTETLAHAEAGTPGPSASNDLSATARLAPVLASLAAAPLTERIAAARAQNAMTHGDAAVIDSAEFFTRVVDALTQGERMAESLTKAAAEGAWTAGGLDPSAALNAVHALLEQPVAEVGARLGLTCHAPEAFPLTLYFLLRYADDPREGLRANALAGGDTAARAMILGYCFAALHGVDWIPATWLEGMHCRERVEHAMQTWG